MKLEKFDLEKVIYGAEVVTRSGRKVTQLTKFQGLGILRVLVGVVGGCINDWHFDGTYRGGEEHQLDLFLVGEPQRIYKNVYRENENVIYTGHDDYDDIKLAISTGKLEANYIKTIEITDEL